MSQAVSRVQEERTGRVRFANHLGGIGEARWDDWPGVRARVDVEMVPFWSDMSLISLPGARHSLVAGRAAGPRGAHGSSASRQPPGRRRRGALGRLARGTRSTWRRNGTLLERFVADFIARRSSFARRRPCRGSKRSARVGCDSPTTWAASARRGGTIGPGYALILASEWYLFGVTCR